MIYTEAGLSFLELLGRLRSGRYVYTDSKTLRDDICHAVWEDQADLAKPAAKSEEPIRYEDYLKTDHWKDKRKQALQRAGYRCQMCNTAGALQVHHRVYELWDEKLQDLTVLCDHCHETFHKESEVEQ